LEPILFYTIEKKSTKKGEQTIFERMNILKNTHNGHTQKLYYIEFKN